MTRVRVGRSGNVCCRAALHLPMSAGAAWGELRDFTRYASQDTFHADFRIEGGVPRRGVKFVVTHRFLLFSVERVGRILRWRELDRSELAADGQRDLPAGYSFSDLSRRGPRHGFPHTFSYYLRSAGAECCEAAKSWSAAAGPRGSSQGGRPGYGSDGSSRMWSCPSATRSCWPSQRDATPTLCLSNQHPALLNPDKPQ